MTKTTTFVNGDFIDDILQTKHDSKGQEEICECYYKIVQMEDGTDKIE